LSTTLNIVRPFVRPSAAPFFCVAAAAVGEVVPQQQFGEERSQTAVVWGCAHQIAASNLRRAGSLARARKQLAGLRQTQLLLQGKESE